MHKSGFVDDEFQWVAAALVKFKLCNGVHYNKFLSYKSFWLNIPVLGHAIRCLSSTHKLGQTKLQSGIC
jgi:hypothetical protein